MFKRKVSRLDCDDKILISRQRLEELLRNAWIRLNNAEHTLTALFDRINDAGSDPGEDKTCRWFLNYASEQMYGVRSELGRLRAMFELEGRGAKWFSVRASKLYEAGCASDSPYSHVFDTLRAKVYRLEHSVRKRSDATVTCCKCQDDPYKPGGSRGFDKYQDRIRQSKEKQKP